MDNVFCVGIMYSSLFEFSELNLLSAFILCFGKSPSIIVLGHAPPVFSHFFSLFTKCLHGRPLLQSFVVFIFSFRFYTKRENKIRAQKTGTSPGVFLNQNMCCASAPGYLAALIIMLSIQLPLQLVLFLGPLLPPTEVVCELQGTLARSIVDQV